MKKHLTQLLLSLLFLVVTAMTCDEQDLAEPIDISCTLKEVELYHWDNAGEKPKEALDNKVLKEAAYDGDSFADRCGGKKIRNLMTPIIIFAMYYRMASKDSDIYGNKLLMKNFPQEQKSLPAFMTIQRRLLKISRQIILLMEGLYP